MKQLFFIFLMGFVLVSCGRMSKPIPPEGSTYPQTYIIQE